MGNIKMKKIANFRCVNSILVFDFIKKKGCFLTEFILLLNHSMGENHE